MILEQRYKRFVFDDPMRRCYNGAFGAHHYEWSEWEVLESNVPPERVDDKLKFWRELNDFAVSQRGESAKREFRIKEESRLTIQAKEALNAEYGPLGEPQR